MGCHIMTNTSDKWESILLIRETMSCLRIPYTAPLLCIDHTTHSSVVIPGQGLEYIQGELIIVIS